MPIILIGTGYLTLTNAALPILYKLSVKVAARLLFLNYSNY